MAKRRQQFMVVSDDESDEDDDNKQRKIAPPRPTNTSARAGAKRFPSVGDAVTVSAFQPLTLSNTSSILPSNNQESAPIYPRDGSCQGGRVSHGLPKSQMSARKSKRRSQTFLSFEQLPAKKSLAVNGTEVAGSSSFFQGKQKAGSLWLDKHSPKSLDDLVVNGKKVTEVQKWLELQLENFTQSDFGGRVLILNGPAGSGKAAVVRVLARAMGLDLCEWATPAPILWKEHLHNKTPGAFYMSKLDDFEAFLETSRKYPLLPLSHDSANFGSFQDERCCHVDSKRINIDKVCKVLLLDDLPFVNDREHSQQVMKALHRLALAAEFPTIVKITDIADRGRKSDPSSKFLADVLHTLERGGVKKVTFNSFTPNVIKRVLRKVVAAENCHVSDESLTVIAKGCEGDLRNALLSLQLVCTRRHLNEDVPAMHNEGPPCLIKIRKNPCDTSLEKEIAVKEKCFEMIDCDEEIQETLTNLCIGRDATLSLFHALGKLLHNKRVKNGDICTGFQCNQNLLEKHKRSPLNMAEPEAILSQAQLETDTIIAFLHENVLQFVDEEAIDNVADVASYLSDADIIGTKRKWHLRSLEYLHDTNSTDPSQLAEAVASSIAARGVLFANTHNPLRKWQSLRAPLLWQVEHSIENKQVELHAQRFGAAMSISRMMTTLIQVLDYGPFGQNICPSPSEIPSARYHPSGQSNIMKMFGDEVQASALKKQKLYERNSCTKDEEKLDDPQISSEEDDIDEW